MNLVDALQVWRRRWILTLVLLLLASAATVAAATKLPKHYQAQSDIVLLPSASSTAPFGHNPYLTYNGSLPMTAQILSYQLMNPITVQSLAGQGYTASFTVALAPTAGGAPILNVLVTGSNKDAVEHTLYGVTGAIATKLSSLQAGISPDNQITDMTLSVDTHPSLSRSKSLRPLVVVLFLGLALALAIPLILDGAVRRRNPDKAGLPNGSGLYPPVGLTTSLKVTGEVRRRIPEQADRPTGHSAHPSDGGSTLRRTGKSTGWLLLGEEAAP
jgi:hypothetical protein